MDIADIYSEVLEKSNIIDVLNHYGIEVHNGKAICPFHKDSNPSMMVSEKKQIAKCFACQMGGNAITFVQKYEEQVNHNPITINDAIIKVAEICNLKVNVSNLKDRKKKYQYVTQTRKYSKEEQNLIEINEYLAKLFSYNLVGAKGKPLDYLHERGLSDEVINELNLGYIPKGQIINLPNNLKSELKITQIQLEELGFLKHGENGYYETFSDRIMFPITDEKGNIVTFAGRVMTDEKPKYLHTPETSIFHKKELLYNFSNAKNYSYNDELFIVEGYMDVIGAKKLGINNVVALMGTELTDEHLKLLKSNKCDLVLALDNDFENANGNIGRDAMIKRIPDLLKEGFKVEVLDISKLGNYKDFGDISQSDIKLEDIHKARTSSFTFMMNYYYFKDKDLNVENIHDVFQKAKDEGFITSTLDESKYKEYILNNSEFSKEEIDEIIFPKDLSSRNPVGNFQNIVMDGFVRQSLEEYLLKRDDNVLSSYYELNKKEISDRASIIFNNNPQKYLSKNAMKLNTALLLYDVLNENEKFSEYETLHSFKYDNVFEKTYIRNINGIAKIDLTFEQKEKIIKQYEDSLRDKDKLSLEEVEELYVINDVSDLDGILHYNNKTMKLFKENIQDRMILNKNDMAFFKYGSLFQNIEKEFISNEFKGSTGNFKTVLFYNNLNGNFNLEKEQLQKVSLKDTIQPTKEVEKEVENTRDYVFSINKILHVPSLDTDTHYFIRIPGTSAKDYFYLPKEDCNWSENNEILFAKLRSNAEYNIYNKYGKIKNKKTAEELKHYWEDKTKDKNKHVFETKTPDKRKTSKKTTKDFHLPKEPSYIPEKAPVCKVFKSKVVDETDNGFYFKIEDKNVLLFATKKICSWNKDNSYLIIHPKKNFITGTGLSKYKYDGKNRKFEKKLFFNELNKYVKVFYPASLKKAPKETLSVPKSNCEVHNSFINIPIELENVVGFIKVNLVKCFEKNTDIIIELSKNEELSFYSKEGSYLGNYNIQQIKDGLSKHNSRSLLLNNRNSIDFNSLMKSYRKLSYKCGVDKLSFIPTTIEPTYEYFETATWVKLNGKYLYKPVGVNVKPYKNELRQDGIYKTKEDVVAFLNTYFANRELEEIKEENLEKEVE